eukprot:6174852-Pleurochrysis_carterae.AAC.6
MWRTSITFVHPTKRACRHGEGKSTYNKEKGRYPKGTLSRDAIRAPVPLGYIRSYYLAPLTHTAGGHTYNHQPQRM